MTARRPGSKRSATPATFARDKIDAAKNQFPAGDQGGARAKPIEARITVSGYEGSELLVARLLIESGADVPLCRHGLPADAMVGRRSRMARGQRRRASSSAPRSSMDLAAVDEFEPDLAIGTTPVVQKAKQRAIPALYFTNLISARPLMGVAGAGSLAQVVNAALANKGRFDEMKAFFGGVGEGYAAGVWEEHADATGREFKTRSDRAKAQEAQSRGDDRDARPRP